MREIPITEMEDSHLQNTILYLVQRKQHWVDAQAEAFAMATLDLGEFIINELTIDQWLANFFAEVRRRQEEL